MIRRGDPRIPPGVRVSSVAVMDRARTNLSGRARYCVALASATAVVGAGAAQATPRSSGIYGGVITVGRGVAGVELGMTRGQVIARLGRPLKELPNAIMSYEALPPTNPHGLFDIYLERSQGAHVRDLAEQRVASRRRRPHLRARRSRATHAALRAPAEADPDRRRRARVSHHRALPRPNRLERACYVARALARQRAFGFDLLFPRGR